MTAEPPEKLRVRPYADEDFSAVVALEINGIHEPYRSAVFVRQQVALSPDTFLVGVEEETIVGFTVAAIVHDRPNTAWILRMMVGNGFRHCGIGTGLLREMCRLLAGRGVREIFLTVSPKNEPAVRLYTREGFNKESLVPAYFGNGEDRFIMKRTC
ncbi:GNAT family N-acetyltransferase [Methanoregula sp. UBA64]|jgi:[ribosomal protein S18]-alanine N-acetyltransferase|uniref:GNAT family N-acetyltransferase n=1 Tax=Methanoregula sp. UBA64 TaxID=1915554 RepID=UPI0025EB7D05|nr:GNAT family N-acetyltransferase [Methanoregula sp. UBA64]